MKEQYERIHSNVQPALNAQFNQKSKSNYRSARYSLSQQRTKHVISKMTIAIRSEWTIYLFKWYCTGT